MSFLNPLYHAVAWLLTGIHSGLGHIFGPNSGASWALAIVLLTVAMRLVLFPVFVKQIRNQRAMQTLQPKMKELQAKYKNDKEKLNQEMMALWRENNANPLSGCLPLLLQIPIFIALYHTLREIKPNHATPACANDPTCYPSNIAGFSQHDIYSAAHAKIFEAPISMTFRSGSDLIHSLGGSPGATKALALILTVIMGATTFITQRQLMAQNASSGNAQMVQSQKILLYVFPVMFLIYGFYFPIGVLLYWLTTNVWSMVQQRVVIRRMDAVPAGAPTVTPAGPAPGAKPIQRGPAKPAPKPVPKPASGGEVVLPPGGAISPGAARPAPRRPTNNRSKKRKKGRR